MPRLFYLLVSLLLLAACDSGEDEETALFEVTAKTPDGQRVEGLQVSIRYPLGSGEGRGPGNEDGEGPAEPILRENYPNPFSEATMLRYDLSEHADVVLEILDLEGRLVTVVEEQEREPGSYTLSWTPDSVTAKGVYLAHLTVSEPGLSEIVFADTTYSIYDPDVSPFDVSPLEFQVGATNSNGLVETDDSLFFPSLYDVPPIGIRGPNNEDLGDYLIGFTAEIILSDSAQEQVYRRVIRDGNNSFELTWEP